MKKNKCVIIFGIIICVVIFGIMIISINKGNDINFVNNMYKDIEILDEKITSYYIKNGILPIANKKIEFSNPINPNDNDIYYEVDLDKLNNITLTYGYKRLDENDFYIINEQSHTIYYYKGVNYNGKTIYSKELDYKYVNLEEYK